MQSARWQADLNRIKRPHAGTERRSARDAMPALPGLSRATRQQAHRQARRPPLSNWLTTQQAAEAPRHADHRLRPAPMRERTFYYYYLKLKL